MGSNSPIPLLSNLILPEPAQLFPFQVLSGLAWVLRCFTIHVLLKLLQSSVQDKTGEAVSWCRHQTSTSMIKLKGTFGYLNNFLSVSAFPACKAHTPVVYTQHSCYTALYHHTYCAKLGEDGV
jgi:hypothetical protein